MGMLHRAVKERLSDDRVARSKLAEAGLRDCREKFVEVSD